MTLTIRRAAVGDAGPIARAHVAGWKLAYEGLVPQDYLDALDVRERTELWRSILTGEITVPGVPRPADFVVEVDATLVGFANVGRFRDEPDDASAGELWAMYVHPEAWGTGAGDALMKTTLDELVRLEARRSYLWVLEGNARARRFYERHGWTSDDVIKTFDANATQVPEIRYSREPAIWRPCEQSIALQSKDIDS